MANILSGLSAGRLGRLSVLALAIPAASSGTAYARELRVEATVDASLIESLSVKAKMRERPMAILSIRNIDERLMRRLRIQAARHGRSMEDEARNILCSALSARPARAQSWVRAIRAGFDTESMDLEIPPREPMREPPEFQDAVGTARCPWRI